MKADSTQVMESRYYPEKHHRRFMDVFTLTRLKMMITAVIAALTVCIVMISIQSGYSFQASNQDYNQNTRPSQNNKPWDVANQDNKLNQEAYTTEHSHNEEFFHKTADSNGLLAEMFQISDHHQGCKDYDTKPCPTVPQCSCIPCSGGTLVDCNNKSLTYIPTELPKNTFVLLLKYNSISEIHVGAFKNYTNLKRLDISYNKITFLKQEHFTGLVHLRDLSVIYNNVTHITQGTFADLKKISKIDLSYNFQLGFHSLENISYGLEDTNITTINLTNVHKRDRGCVQIKQSNFENLSKTNIQYLILDSNQLVSLTLRAVDYIPKSLRGISLKDNRLSFGPYINSFFAWCRQANNLEIFVMSQQNMNHIIDTLLPIEKAEEKTLERGKPNTTTHQLTINDFQRRMKRQGLQKGLTGMSSQQTMLNLERYINLENNDTCCESCLGKCKFVRPIHLAKNLVYLDLSEDHVRAVIPELCFCPSNKLRKLNVNTNILWNIQGPITGLINLEILDMSGNSCSELSDTAFHYFPSLQRLNLSNNFLGYRLKKDVNGRIFQKLGNLTDLNLSENKIFYLPDKIFSGLNKLANLSLAGNHMIKFKVNIKNLVHLQQLDLRENFLVELDESVTSFFDKIPRRNNLTLKLSGNLFHCTCSELPFIQWISETKVVLIDLETYSCTFSNGTKGNLIQASHIYKTLISECASYTILITSSISILVFFLALVSVAILYRYRWNLQYMYYSAKLKYKGYIKVKDEDTNFDFDAFVSYCDTEGRFVRQQIIPELEEKRELNLLIHERDFLAGNFVADNIMRAITTSRKVLIILSKNYLRSTWCCYEMNMARMEQIKTGRDVICVLMKESVPSKDLPLELIDIIRDQTYLELPPEQQDLTRFWDRMKTALLE